jgi:hypothetical protein
MNSDRDPTVIVRSWLEIGVTALPDRVLDAVLDELPAARQRRPWLGQRLLNAQPALTVALAGALAIAVTLLSFTYLSSPRLGAPPHSDTTPTPTLARATLLSGGGRIDPGTYRLGNWLPVPVAFDVPAGLRHCGGEPALCSDSIAALSFGTIINVADEPCGPSETMRDPPVGPSVDDLVTALRGLPGFRVHSVRDVVVDGYSGTELEVTAPVTACSLWPWASPYRVNGVSPRETNRMRILDVEGTRVVLTLAYHPTTPPSDMAVLQQVMDSVRFDDR